MDSMITRFAKLIDRLLDSLIGTGIGEVPNSILASMAAPVAALRRWGVPYLRYVRNGRNRGYGR